LELIVSHHPSGAHPGALHAKETIGQSAKDRLPEGELAMLALVHADPATIYFAMRNKGGDRAFTGIEHRRGIARTGL